MRKTSKLLAILISIIMVVPFIPFSVFAAITGSYTLKFDGAWTIGNVTVTSDKIGPAIVLDANDEITLTNFDPDTMVAKIEASDGFNCDLVVDANGKTRINTTTASGLPGNGTGATTLEFKVLAKNQGGNQGGNQNPGPQQGTTNATVTVSGTNITEAGLAINGEFVDLWEFPAPASITRNVSYNYDAATANGKVTMRFETRHNMKYNGTITINGQAYNVKDYLDYTNRDQYLDHYSGQMVSFEIAVPKADNYNVEINVDRADENTTWIGNFLWTGDPDQEFLTTPDGNKVTNDNYIGHSKLEIVKIEYVRNGHTVTKTIDQLTDLGEQEIGPGIYYHNYTDGSIEYGYLTKLNGKAVNYDDGSLVVPEGAKVTMKIVPTYGYQVTSFGVNGANIITGANISEFTFTVKKGNFHLGAQVTSVNNTVKSDTKAVTSGVIKMGDTEITSGTARLEVADANATDAKKAEFKEKIGADYELSEILNISLNQVFYKGTADDVWTGDAIEDLKEYAIIQLQLAEDIDPENTIIYHNIHDGDEYEEIEIISYEKETKTLTIKVKSFSNYAIATKTTKTEEADKELSPKTGDAIEVFFVTFAIAAIGMGTVSVIRRKR